MIANLLSKKSTSTIKTRRVHYKRRLPAPIQPGRDETSTEAPRKSNGMRREGRQHGTVRTHFLPPDGLNPRPKSRVLNRLPDGRPVAGVFARVPSKPTNHSKFTGRCGRPACACCHETPAWKSKGKAKGQTKLRARAAVELGLEDEEAGGACADEWAGEEEEMEEEEEIAVVDGHKSLVNNNNNNNNNNNTTPECAREDEDGGWFFVENAI